MRITFEELFALFPRLQRQGVSPLARYAIPTSICPSKTVSLRPLKRPRPSSLLSVEVQRPKFARPFKLRLSALWSSPIQLPLGIEVKFTEVGTDLLAVGAPLEDPYNPRRTILIRISPAHLPPGQLSRASAHSGERTASQKDNYLLRNLYARKRICIRINT
ncbi:hypothetical protein EVAR_35436_1 [Eumeta japonica]|uniref:Uncharacterized protein n=1 Tax=Eumeta variegata TaxID=151549 RepID=A0A4C1XB24_EUMVA|nr:hypothetical protein EVAR_35436_1 [Eumeta japonica]